MSAHNVTAKSLLAPRCLLFFTCLLFTYTSRSAPLTLTIVAPNEKRQDQRIPKTVVISPHFDTLLCPVAAYETYIESIATESCHPSYPVVSSIQLNCLNRDLKHHD